MKFLEINSKTFGILIVKLDNDDYDSFKNYSFNVSKSGNFLYVRVNINGKKSYLHRLITNAKNGVVVDHKNRDTLDNRKSNLQVCTHQENLRNQKRKENKSGHTGVCWNKNAKKWTAQIKHNYKKIHLGVFENLNDAVIARKNAEKLYWNI